MTPEGQPYRPEPSCMGGWCAIRERCGAYHAVDRRAPVERLCPTGDERFAFLPLMARIEAKVTETV